MPAVTTNSGPLCRCAAAAMASPHALPYRRPQRTWRSPARGRSGARGVRQDGGFRTALSVADMIPRFWLKGARLAARRSAQLYPGRRRTVKPLADNAGNAKQSAARPQAGSFLGREGTCSGALVLVKTRNLRIFRFLRLRALLFFSHTPARHQRIGGG